MSPSFFNTVGLEILEGHGFNENVSVDSTNILISQSFVELMGSGSAIGKTVMRNDINYNVIGVVNDYLYGDVYGNGKTGPVMFYNQPDYGNTLYVKIDSETSTMEALASIEEILKEYNPGFPFDYRFENDLFNARFKTEVLVGELTKIFSILAIIIFCLGLFGIASYTAEQRRKEIGVRKVLGSSIAGIVSLLSKDFMQLVVIAILIACPLAWWFMRNWLESYAYRISINIWAFVIAGICSVGIALLTVSFQSFKAANANPVKSLRTE